VRRCPINGARAGRQAIQCLAFVRFEQWRIRARGFLRRVRRQHYDQRAAIKHARDQLIESPGSGDICAAIIGMARDFERARRGFAREVDGILTFGWRGDAVEG